MSEFEKEFNNCLHFGFIPNEPQNKIIEHFKYWQTPKQLVVVPRFIAEWFEDRMGGTFSGVISSYSFSSEEAVRWVHDNGGIDLLCKMKLYSYTVEKEKKYILKHIDLSEQYKNESVYLSHSRYAKLKHESYSKGADMSKFKQCHFTQSEIDKLNIGSYEQKEVEP